MLERPASRFAEMFVRFEIVLSSRFDTAPSAARLSLTIPSAVSITPIAAIAPLWVEIETAATVLSEDAAVVYDL